MFIVDFRGADRAADVKSCPRQELNASALNGGCSGEGVLRSLVQLLLPAGTLDICHSTSGVRVSFSSLEENAFFTFVMRDFACSRGLAEASPYALAGGLDPSLRSRAWGAHIR